MENTYGYTAINRWTFNQDPRYPETISKEMFVRIRTALTINNWAFNFFGYLNSTRFLSGQIRMLVGLAVLARCTLWIFSSLRKGEPVNRFAVEGILTAVTQIFRGYVEAFLVYGRLVNLTLDVIFTPFNLDHHSKPIILPREDELKPYLSSNFRYREHFYLPS